MPVIAISSAALNGPAGITTLRAAIIVTMLHPRDKQKRDTLADAFALESARLMAETHQIDIVEKSSVLP